MIIANDIHTRIETDFGDKAPNAFEMIREAITNSPYLNSPRIVRCIVFLSEGSIDELKHSIKIAREDPRDIMLFAEYIDLKEGQSPKRVRDFNKTFELCEQDVKE